MEELYKKMRGGLSDVEYDAKRNTAVRKIEKENENFSSR
jgi:hypothetical protein